MKHLLIRLSAGLLLVLTATSNLPALSQSASPSASASPSDQFTNNPVFRGVNVTAQQKTKLLNLKKEESEQIAKILTPAQKKIVSTQGARAVKFTKPQEEKMMMLAKKIGPKYEAVFTPEQIKQIRLNLQALQEGGSGKTPVSTPSGQK
jgi:Spy/CpxP family protein refolding chaperone